VLSAQSYRFFLNDSGACPIKNVKSGESATSLSSHSFICFVSFTPLAAVRAQRNRKYIIEKFGALGKNV
jgi:hypothetical protein